MQKTRDVKQQHSNEKIERQLKTRDRKSSTVETTKTQSGWKRGSERHCLRWDCMAGIPALSWPPEKHTALSSCLLRKNIKCKTRNSPLCTLHR